MLAHLDELKRKEDLELLRAPLMEYNLFPYDKDPETASITIEELKKLVRHWKLHEARGFWKTHSEKEDLMRALLDYMHHHNLYKIQPSQSPKEPKRPDKAKPSRPRPGGGNKRAFKQYNGDLFSRFDHSDGLLYLSRMVPADKDADPAAYSDLGNLLAKAENDDDEGTEVGSNGFADGADAHLSLDSIKHNKTKTSVAEQLYKFSIPNGHELSMVEEGVLQAVSQVLERCGDMKVNFFCAATLMNLSVAANARETMIDFGVIPNCVVPILNSMVADDTTAIFCSKTLYNLTCEEGIEDKIFNSGASVLTGMMQYDNDNVKLFACAATVNIFPCLERHRLVDPLIPALSQLAQNAHEDMHRIFCEVAYRMAYYEFLRTTMVDLGIVTPLTTVAAIEDLPLDLCVLLASALSNLSCSAEARDKIVRAGAVTAIGNLSKAAIEELDWNEELLYQSQLELKKLCATTLCNLSQNEKLGALVVESNGVSTLVDIGLGATDMELKTKVAGALANLTMSQELGLLGKMVEDGAHRVLMELVTKDDAIITSGAPPRVQMVRLVVAALCNLLYDQSRHEAMVTQGILETLTVVLGVPSNFTGNNDGFSCIRETDTFVLRTVAVAFSNLSMSAEHVDRFISSGFLRAVVDLMKGSKDIEILRTCIDAFGYLSSFLPVGKLLIENEFVVSVSQIGLDLKTRGINFLNPGSPFSKSKSFYNRTGGLDMEDNILLNEDAANAAEEEERSTRSLMTRCADILCNLSNEESFCVPLIDQNGLKCALAFCESDDIGILVRCANVLCRLSMSSMNASEVRMGLSRLEKKSSDKDVMHSCSLAMFAMSCQPDVIENMTEDPAMLKRLISMMREGIGQTQLYSAKALCNLSRHGQCAEILLNHGVVADLVVIALLRTNSEEIKEISSQSLFNLLVHQKCRPKMVEQGVVWALMKLAKLESIRTQDICAQTLYNLSYEPSTAKTIVDLGMVPVLVNMVINDPPTGIATQRYLSRTMVNLCEQPMYAKRLVEDGVVPVLAELVKSQDHAVTHDCTTTFRLLCRPEVGKHLKIVEANVVKIFEMLFDQQPHSSYDVVACLNYFTMYQECRAELMIQKVAVFLLKVLQDKTSHELVALSLVSLFHLMFEESSCEQLAQEGVVDCVLSCCESDPAHVPIVMQMFRLLSSVEETHIKMAGAEGDVTRVVIKTAEDKSMPLETRAAAVITIRNLSFTAESQSMLLQQGILSSLGLMERQGDFGSLSDAQLEFTNHIAVALRNMSCSATCPKQFANHSPSFLPLLKAIAESGNEKVRDNLAFCLVNLVANQDSSTTIVQQGAPAVLSYLANNVSSVDVQKMCAAAIASQTDRQDHTFVEGSVVALMSIIERPGSTAGRNRTRSYSLARLGPEQCCTPVPPAPHPNSGTLITLDVREKDTDSQVANWDTFVCPLEGVVFCSVSEARRKVEPRLCDLNKPVFTQTHGQFTKILIEVAKMDSSAFKKELAGNEAFPPTVPET